MNNTSFANAPHTIARMLQDISDYKQCDLNWWTSKGSSFKEIFPDNLYSELQDISNISESMIEVGGVDKINKFLKDNGFSIALQPSDPWSVAAACIIEILVKWADEIDAEETTVELKNGMSVPAVGVTNISNIVHVENHEFPIIELNTSSENKVFITQYVKELEKGPTILYKLIGSWKEHITDFYAANYSGNVIFPMVDFNVEDEIEELIGAMGLDVNDNGFVIGQALSQHILKINAEGALAKAAAACTAFMGGLPDVDICIDTAFIIWFEHNGTIPFCAYIMEDDMKKPLSLTG